MKKGIISFLCLIMLLTTAGIAVAASEITVKVNQKTVVFPDAKPYVEGSRVMIPVRFVSEALGAKVDYKNKTVLIEKDGKNISMKVDSMTVLVSGKKIMLDVPVRMKKERVFVPLRFVSEALNSNVDWNAKEQIVTITTKKGPQLPTETPFQWGTETNLGKSLFINNMTVQNGKLRFSLPINSKAVLYKPGNGNGEVLKSGEDYTYSLGKSQGYLMITMVYPGKETVEGYAVYLDTNSENLDGKFANISNDAAVETTVIINGKMVSSASTLSKVIESIKKLK
ncbi:copper amine oxidase N-terminal domain-containing protein [Paenibacillus macquariensis]|uniref:Copper amine oxidase N-terminal domain-containing protein n=1 Tax=Paenibacillus macquariensis TaxID=948756 RepID=A0ABY1KEH7_9BACL|nr:copper amine oxidase N-terminal domain-containing protein [Paenibacillus macquariensis]OAB30511.1 hypothetical protein PMSM_22730 [Paenibacillus macquariensis subsp. macquariensis]SIR71149.1 Copper amine oxidase N-terminal domain-containing protein [Paenibacillus macquariensis]